MRYGRMALLLRVLRMALIPAEFLPQAQQGSYSATC